MRFSEAIDDYRTAARHELAHSRATYYSYVAILKQFARWLEANGHPDPPVREITPQLLRRYHFWVVGQNLRPRTIRGKLNALRALFGYLTAQGVIAENPALVIKLPRLDAAERLLVSDDDLQRLLEAAERQRTDFRCVRDRALLSVLIFGALRRSELLALKVADVNLHDQVLVVQQGKGRKSRAIPLCDEALSALRDWLAIRQSLSCRHASLFVGEGRRPVGEQGLARMLEEIKAIAGMRGDRRVLPHSIRHAAATRLLRNGADLKSIQTWLGHTDLKTTAIYLHSDEQQIRAVADLAGFRRKPESPSDDNRAAESPSRTGYWRHRRRVG
jgi:site-specific recombinase XerD